MNITQRLQEMARSAGGQGMDGRDEWGHEAWRGNGRSAGQEYGGYGGATPGGRWSGLVGRSLEVVEVQEEVAAEQEGRLAIVGPDEALNRLLLARLRGQPPITPGQGIRREGFFTLATLPPESADRTDSPTYEWDAPLDLTDGVADHDILLYLFSACAGWQATDAHWYARLRGSHLPILPVAALPGDDAPAGWSQAEFAEEMRQRLGVRPAFAQLSPADEWAEGGDGDRSDNSLLLLVQRILSLRPRLAVPLAQEVPGCRAMIAQRVIRTGSLMSLLLGSEPVPLLDLPLHVATQWKVALQLGAIYGRPGLDYRSREMVGTVAVNLLVRHLAQQLLKLVPLVGWLLSGLLSGASTWLLGQALIRHYQEQQVIPLPVWPPEMWKERLANQRTRTTRMRRIFTDRLGKIRSRKAGRGMSGGPEAQEIHIWPNGSRAAE
ncbi:MAG: hypothetical protein KJZ86_23075 [Caldilineaceae bacterium]|nr:hypothetical protein [Caldilineaceae bacterium]HRJ42745.1 hypothetical protein [Caldilineaceae bacterium]